MVALSVAWTDLTAVELRGAAIVVCLCARSTRSPIRRPFQKEFGKRVEAEVPATAQGKPLEIRFQDEARTGQQGTLTRVWAQRRSRLRPPCVTRYQGSFARSPEPMALTGSFFGAH